MRELCTIKRTVEYGRQTLSTLMRPSYKKIIEYSVNKFFFFCVLGPWNNTSFGKPLLKVVLFYRFSQWRFFILLLLLMPYSYILIFSLLNPFLSKDKDNRHNSWDLRNKTNKIKTISDFSHSHVRVGRFLTFS